jgi:hypothetical protein
MSLQDSIEVKLRERKDRKNERSLNNTLHEVSSVDLVIDRSFDKVKKEKKSNVMLLYDSNIIHKFDSAKDKRHMITDSSA